jgi:hypothetical protein
MGKLRNPLLPSTSLFQISPLSFPYGHGPHGEEERRQNVELNIIQAYHFCLGYVYWALRKIYLKLSLKEELPMHDCKRARQALSIYAVYTRECLIP